MPAKQDDKVYIPVPLQTLYYDRIASYIAKGMWKNVSDFIIEAIVDKLLEIESEEELKGD